LREREHERDREMRIIEESNRASGERRQRATGREERDRESERVRARRETEESKSEYRWKENARVAMRERDGQRE
jgi:hypothetical protein